MRDIFYVSVALLLVSGPVTAGEPTTDEPITSEPIKCFEKAASVPGGMTVGLVVKLCSGTTDADKTIKCYLKAWAHPDDGGFGLPVGIAITLCKSNSLE